jgi:mRNA-degrading endonuclease RelE of RelBE toxin-antitoxin system
MTYKVELHRQAEKKLDRLDKTTSRRIHCCIDQLANGLFDPRISNEVKMAPERRYARVGNWRIIYRIDEANQTIFTTAIQHRSKAYEHL